MFSSHAMRCSCGELVLCIIVGIAAINLLFAVFGWHSFIKQSNLSTVSNDSTEKLHLALENLRHELRLVHSNLPTNLSSNTKPLPDIFHSIIHKVDTTDSATTSFKQPHTITSSHAVKSVVVFTMDSIASYEKNSLNGGAAGELLYSHVILRIFSI